MTQPLLRLKATNWSSHQARKVATVCQSGESGPTSRAGSTRGQRASKATLRRYKNDCGRHGGLWFVQKGSENLPQDGAERPANRFRPKDSVDRQPHYQILRRNARCLHHPYDDALVVSIRVGDYNTHQVLVDNGSSTDIHYYPAFQQVRIDRERLVSTNAPLVGFGGTKVYPLDAVTLPVTVGDYPQQIIKVVTLLVVDCLSAYNATLGWPTFNSWKAVTSTYHLMIKFPIKYEVGEIRGDQVVASECYIAILEMDDHLQIMNIGE